MRADYLKGVEMVMGREHKTDSPLAINAPLNGQFF